LFVQYLIVFNVLIIHFANAAIIILT
jgi:hypothetical protein